MFVNSNQFVECDRYLYTSPKFVFSVLFVQVNSFPKKERGPETLYLLFLIVLAEMNQFKKCLNFCPQMYRMPKHPPYKHLNYFIKSYYPPKDDDQKTELLEGGFNHS